MAMHRNHLFAMLTWVFASSALSCSSGEATANNTDSTAVTDDTVDAPDSGDTATVQECIPRDEAPALPKTASEYADLCNDFLGVTPTIDCGDGVPVPIYVDGVEVFGQTPVCDNPDFKGSCPVGSRVGRLDGQDADAGRRRLGLLLPVPGS